jgi:hypothetical protein
MKLLCYVFALEDAGANNKDHCNQTHGAVRVCLAASAAAQKKRALRTSLRGDQLTDKGASSQRPELGEVHPVIVGRSTRNRPFLPRPINDRMASRSSQRNRVVVA